MLIVVLHTHFKAGDSPADKNRAQLKNLSTMLNLKGAAASATTSVSSDAVSIIDA